MTPSLMTQLARGAAAGAAGTTALNAATYLDMTWRGRPASQTPERTVDAIASSLGVRVPGDEDTRPARRSALGALSGIGAGIGTGVALGLLRGRHPQPSRARSLGTAFALVMVAGNAPMTVLGVTDPRTWSATDWAADVLPHLAYAVVAATTLDALDA
ncbi:MAG: hypothetical protein M3P48_02170 [Actinomycetota bacterium]|nr:hypothetical protein [Actinomycetota bacterium]